MPLADERAASIGRPSARLIRAASAGDDLGADGDAQLGEAPAHLESAAPAIREAASVEASSLVMIRRKVAADLTVVPVVDAVISMPVAREVPSLAASAHHLRQPATVSVR